VLLERDDQGECDVVVKGTIAGEPRGWVRLDDGTFQGDRAADAPLSDGGLRALAGVAGQALTWTCVPPGSGTRIGIDRDADLMFDGDEVDAGSDPADPTSLPAGVVLCDSGSSAGKHQVKVAKNAAPSGDEGISIKGEFVLANSDAPIDPIAYGFSFRIDDKNGNTILSRVVPAGAPVDRGEPGWATNKKNTRWMFKDRDGLVADGITKVIVQDKTARTPGLFTFRATGKNADFRIDPSALPVSVVVVLGNGYQTSNDQCATGTFNDANGAKPNCSGTDRINCR
jgi:hypothetical protein